MADKHPGGRPTVMTPETIAKLEYAFSIGSDDASACLYAGIGNQTLYNYQERHPEFVERKKQLKAQQVFKARAVIENALNNDDTTTARWLLERKCKDEFSTKTEIKTEPQTIVKYVTKEEREAVDKHIDDIINNGGN